MSERHFVFKLGPLEHLGGASKYFVDPGEPDNYEFPALEDEIAWDMITNSFAPEHLACEPMLDTDDRPFGVVVEPHNRLTAYTVAVVAFANMKRSPMADVRTDGLVSDFCLAAKAFRNSPCGKGQLQPNGLTAVFKSGAEVLTRATLEGDALKEGALRFLSLDIEIDEETNTMLSFGTVFQNEPMFVADALSRAFGLDSVPIPIVGTESKPGRPNDFTLFLLIPALTALAELDTDVGPVSGDYSIAEREISVEIS